MAPAAGRRAAGVALGALLAALAAPPAPAAERVAGSLRVDGAARTFTLTVPEGRPTGVVVLLHGGGERQRGAAIADAVGLDAHAERLGFVVAAPDARGGRFHAGACCGRRSARTDDIRLVRRLVAHVRRRHGVRGGPVVAAGFSNGGFLALRLACETRLLDAVATVAATELVRRCRPPRPVSVLHVHARDDRRVPFAGGGVFHAWTPGALELAERWRRRDGCPRGATRRTRTAQLLVAETAGCRDGTRVRLVVPATGGHAWPGALAPYGPGSPAADATAEVAALYAGA